MKNSTFEKLSDEQRSMLCAAINLINEVQQHPVADERTLRFFATEYALESMRKFRQHVRDEFLSTFDAAIEVLESEDEEYVKLAHTRKIVVQAKTYDERERYEEIIETVIANVRIIIDSEHKLDDDERDILLEVVERTLTSEEFAYDEANVVIEERDIATLEFLHKESE
jgi:hypothetical protein